MVGVLAELPVGDEPLEPLDLVPLVGQERGHEVLAEHLGKAGVRFQCVEGIPEPLRQQLGPRRVVAVALQLGGRLHLAGDAQVDGCADGGHGQVGVGGGVAEADLHPGGGTPLRRDPDHRAAVVQAPVDQPRCEGVGPEPLVGVDGRVEQRAQRPGVCQDPADGMQAGRRQPVRAAGVAEHILPGGVRHRDVHVEPGPALVVERLGHERRQQAAVPGDLLHRRLEPERPVRRVAQFGMAEVDLELAGRELVVGRGDPQPRVPQLPQHVQEHALRVALAADHVHVPQVVGVPLPAAAWRGLAQVELKLGTADEGVAEAGDPFGHPAGHGARRFRRGRAVGGHGVAEAPRRPLLPRQRRQRAQVGADGDVGQAVFQAALHRHHVTHGGGVVHRPAERQPVADRRAKLAEQHVPAAVHADHVRIGHPDHIDPLLPEPLGNGGDVGRVRHSVLPLARRCGASSLAGMNPCV